MKTVIKAAIATAIIAMSYNASAKDGAFTGNVQFEKAAVNSLNAGHYQKQGTAERSHSGVVFTQPKAHLSFAEKLLSAADK
ncbi:MULTISPECIES: hypothetical protein [Photobacterium]|uniref:Uncharacterized protein n=1 Tax=Photobacterium malacitanum TaxID=2204294 RepID=A0A1Y6MQZ5_9GAMM|nr:MULTISPECIES: hypothetical protein [Photobacterium]SMY36679.1 hypothetical protein PMAL9190_02513 [Photobacterium malacitanum]SMY38210.1 hypothetical protein PMAL9190_03440 [Photobacterium malacitanum]SMY39015.1 hypothetical protein PMAL9190_03843 [Photobacterium malacitanum]